MTASLTALEQRFALVGGLAVSARAGPTLTRVADLVVAVDSDEAAEGIVRDLVRMGYQVVATVEQGATERLASVRLAHASDGDLLADLLFASSGIELEIVDEADVLTIAGSLTLPVATIGHLIAMKLLARDDRNRPADADDLRSLRDVAGPSDWEAAATAVELIAARGFERRRDLAAALAELRSGGAY